MSSFEMFYKSFRCPVCNMITRVFDSDGLIVKPNQGLTCQHCQSEISLAVTVNVSCSLCSRNYTSGGHTVFETHTSSQHQSTIRMRHRWICDLCYDDEYSKDKSINVKEVDE